jgi:hypothetical protein
VLTDVGTPLLIKMLIAIEYLTKEKHAMAIKARIWWDTSAQAYVLSSSYNDKLVEGLKGLIPSGDRNFDPTSKFWYVKEQYGEFLRQMCINAFGLSAVQFTSKVVAEQAHSQTYNRAGSGAQGAMLNSATGTTEDALVAFANMVPYDAMKKAYLLTCQILHPDKPTGDGAKMMKLNDLWARIEKEFYKR